MTLTLHQLDHGALPMIDRMQAHGLLVDQTRCREFGRFCVTEMAKKREQLQSLVGFPVNPNSGDQVASLLFDYLQLTPTRMTESRKRFSTNDKALEGLRDEHDSVPLILDYRELSKLKGTFCDGILSAVSDDGRLHPNIRTTRVPTGRLAAHNPNVLAMPTRSELGQEIRKLFIPGPGHELLTIDYSQIEMMVTASESGDEGMIARAWAGDDEHKQAGADCFNVDLAAVTKQQRQVGKTVGFGVLNDMSGVGLLDQFRLFQCFKTPATETSKAVRYTEDECDQFVDRWHDKRPGVASWKEAARAQVRRYGFIDDMWGRRRYFPEVKSAIPRIVSEGLRAAVNHRIQAGAQGIIKRAMAIIWYTWLPLIQPYAYCEPLLQVHDELLWEIDKGAGEWIGPMLQEAMASAKQLLVPVKSKFAAGMSWGDLEK